MGNSLQLPCLCYGTSAEAPTTAGVARKSRKKKTALWKGRTTARHVVPVDVPDEHDLDEEEGIKAACPECRVEPCVSDDGGFRVKIVMKKKEAEELVARLEQRDTAGRKARMPELNTDLGGGGGGAVTMSPRREAWRPRLASIPEN